MVQAENNDSGISNFQLDNCSGRDHRSLDHLSKFTLKHASNSSTDQGGWKRRSGNGAIVHLLFEEFFIELF
jgi:hypothetical protein